MGGWQSSTKPDEQQLNYILSSLSHQKECIEGLVKYIEEQQTQFNLFSQTRESQVCVGESESFEYEDVVKNQEERLNPLDRNKRTLAKANLSSLYWHVRVVQTSFSTLQKTILDLAHQFATGQRRDEIQAAWSHIDTINNLKLRVDGCEKQTEEFSNSISIKKRENAHLRKKNEELLEQITTVESRNAELETNESSHKKEIDRLNQLLQDREITKKQITEHRNVIAIKTWENEQLRKKNEELIEQITNIERRNAELETNESSHKKEMECLNQLLQDREITKKQIAEHRNVIAIKTWENEQPRKKKLLQDREITKKQIEEHSNDISIKTRENKHLRKRNEELIEQITNLESRNAELETNESSHKKQMECLNQLLQDRENTKNKIEEHCNEIDIQKRQNEHIRKKNEELIQQITNLESRNAELETNESSHKKEMECLNQLLQDQENTKKKIEEDSNEIAIQKKENEHLRKKNEELTEQITNLESRNAELETNESSHKKEMECLNQLLQDRENTRTVQLFYQSRGDTMSKVVDGLKTLLVNKLEMERNKMQFIDCQSEQDVNPRIPLFILCINTSTLETDAGSALQKVKSCVSSNVSILIFHHKDVHALPSQSSERVLPGSDFKELGGIFDLAFLSEKGIYPCDINDDTASGIVKVLKPKD